MNIQGKSRGDALKYWPQKSSLQLHQNVPVVEAYLASLCQKTFETMFDSLKKAKSQRFSHEKISLL